MWGRQLAISLAGYLHQLTATPDPQGPGLLGWGIREGKAMIATLRHRLICVSAPPDPPRHSAHPAPTPGHPLHTEILTRLRALPATA